MKKIILSMAMLAMVGATATAQKNNDGLTPSRPLTSGELFQGMSRAIPTGRVVLPYGLDVTFDKTVHLIFTEAFTRSTFSASSAFPAMMFCEPKST